MRKLALILLLGATACTPSEVDHWLGWWEDDPQAAEDFAEQDWVQRSLAYGCDSYCDVDDPDVQSGASDSSSAGRADEPDVSGGSDTAGVYEPWISLAACESGGNWSINTGNGYYGGLQFALGSWQAVGGSGLPSDASPSEQVYRAERLRDAQGWGAWPTCARKIGLL